MHFVRYKKIEQNYEKYSNDHINKHLRIIFKLYSPKGTLAVSKSLVINCNSRSFVIIKNYSYD